MFALDYVALLHGVSSWNDITPWLFFARVKCLNAYLMHADETAPCKPFHQDFHCLLS